MKGPIKRRILLIMLGTNLAEQGWTQNEVTWVARIGRGAN